MSEFSLEELDLLSYGLTAMLHNKNYCEDLSKTKIKNLFNKVIQLNIEIRANNFSNFDEVSDE